MTFLSEWVESIACYLIFLTAILSLLPSKKYEIYLRFFGGILLMLFVFRPFLGGFHLEEELSRLYQEFSFQQDSRELEQKIAGVEETQRELLRQQYEKAIGEDIGQMAEFYALEVKTMEMNIGMKEETLGKLEKLKLKLCYVGEEAEGETAGLAAQRAKNRLKEQICQYYGMEAADVEVQVEEG